MADQGTSAGLFLLWYTFQDIFIPKEEYPLKFKSVMPFLLSGSILAACNSGALPSGSSSSSSTLGTQSVSSAVTSTTGTLAPGTQMKSGDTMALYTQSHNIFQLTLGSDGNLVLSEMVRNPGSSSITLWATNTSSGRTLKMQTDGNLVLYDAQNKALWATGTFGHTGAAMNMLPNGSMSVVQASTVLWSSDSVLYQNLASPANLITLPMDSTTSGQTWVGSPSSWTQLAINSGNLVLSTSPSHNPSAWTPLWSTGTTTGSTLRMQADGNLVLYDIHGKALWDTGTWGHRGLYLSIAENGTMSLTGCSASGNGYLNTTGASGCTTGKSVQVWTLKPHTAS